MEFKTQNMIDFIDYDNKYKEFQKIKDKLKHNIKSNLNKVGLGLSDTQKKNF